MSTGRRNGGESAHTPGPWTWAANTQQKEIPIRAVDQEGFGFSIVFLNTSDEAKKAEAKANARLIAAAPELLAALVAMVDAHAIPSSICAERPAYEAARAAIAKASGSAS